MSFLLRQYFFSYRPGLRRIGALPLISTSYPYYTTYLSNQSCRSRQSS